MESKADSSSIRKEDQILLLVIKRQRAITLDHTRSQTVANTACNGILDRTNRSILLTFLSASSTASTYMLHKYIKIKIQILTLNS